MSESTTSTTETTTEIVTTPTTTEATTTEVVAPTTNVMETEESTREPIKGSVELMSLTPPTGEPSTETEVTSQSSVSIFDSDFTATFVSGTTLPPNLPTTRPPLPIIEYEKRPSNRHKIEGVRLHPIKSPKPCKQRNGIVCEFGCLDNLRFLFILFLTTKNLKNFRCDCPKSEKSCIRGIHCPFVKDLRAIYENSTKTLKLFSKQISSVLKNATLYDKIYLEFGEIGPAEQEGPAGATGAASKSSMGIGKGDFVFTTQEKERDVISLEVSPPVLVRDNSKDIFQHTDVSKLFDEIPYLMSVTKPLKVGEVNYGLSVCALNSSLVPVIMDNVFMEQSLFNDNSISSFTVSLNPAKWDQEKP